MKAAQRSLLWVATAALVVGVVIWFFLQRENTESSLPPGSDVVRELGWHEGSMQYYDVTVDSSFLMMLPGAAPGGAGSQTLRVKIEGVLEHKTLKVTPAKVLVGMRFQMIDLSVNDVADAGVNRALTRPFRVRLMRDGEAEKFEFPGKLSSEHRQVLENLVRMFQVVMKSGDNWSTREANASGIYMADYVRTGAREFGKSKRRYTGTLSGESAAVSSVASKESIRLSPGVDWITGMTIEETLFTADPGGPEVEVTNRAELLLRSGAFATTATKWKFKATAEPDQSAADIASAKPVMSPEEAREKITAEIVLLDGKVEGRSLSIHRLRDLILQDGILPQELISAMKSPELSDRTRADLYLALELAGTPESQVALSAVLSDTSWSANDATRAIVALGGVKSPTNETLSALWDQAHGGGVQEGRENIPSSAALALGSLGQNMREQDNPDYASLRSNLQSNASSASDPHQQAAYLHALGNTFDPDPQLRTDIAGFLESPEPEVRSAAAKTLGRLGADPVADELLFSFERESSDRVRGSIAAALAEWETPSEPAMKIARRVVQSEGDETVRYNMAMMLSKNLAQYPQNRPVLEDLLMGEPSGRIRQEVAEALFE